MAMPGLNYPPASIANWAKECVAKGRDDLAKAILDQWNKTYAKYPQVRTSWGAATKIGMASIKKNIFSGQDFVTWIAKSVNTRAAA